MPSTCVRGRFSCDVQPNFLAGLLFIDACSGGRRVRGLSKITSQHSVSCNCRSSRKAENCVQTRIEIAGPLLDFVRFDFFDSS